VATRYIWRTVAARKSRCCRRQLHCSRQCSKRTGTGRVQNCEAHWIWAQAALSDWRIQPGQTRFAASSPACCRDRRGCCRRRCCVCSGQARRRRHHTGKRRRRSQCSIGQSGGCIQTSRLRRRSHQRPSHTGFLCSQSCRVARFVCRRYRIKLWCIAHRQGRNLCTKAKSSDRGQFATGGFRAMGRCVRG